SVAHHRIATRSQGCAGRGSSMLSTGRSLPKKILVAVYPYQGRPCPRTCFSTAWTLCRPSLRALHEDLIVHQPFDSAGPGIVRAHPEPGKMVRHDSAGLGVPDENLKRVFSAVHSRENSDHRLIGAKLFGQRTVTSIAVLDSSGRIHLPRDTAGVDDAVAA